MERITMSIEEQLAREFDELIAARGYTSRSEAMRDLLRRGAIATGGGLAAIWSIPPLVREAYGNPVPLPAALRSVEGGLGLFTARWQVAGPIIKADSPNTIPSWVFMCTHSSLKWPRYFRIFRSMTAPRLASLSLRRVLARGCGKLSNWQAAVKQA